MIVKLPEPVAAIYKAVADLDRLYRDYGRKFTPDGHLVGSIGEVIAAQALGLTLHKGSHPGHDATDKDGRDVQIKMTAGKQIALYDTCDRLVVLRVIDPEHAEIVYDGPGAPAWEHAGPKQKNGQRTISLKKLTGIAVMSDEASLWLQQLKAVGRSQGFLTYAQVNESMPLAIVDPEEIEQIVEALNRAGIRVVPVGN